MGDWLEPGSKAPDFTLASHDGTKVKLSAFRGRPVVLYFYPKMTRRAAPARPVGSAMRRPNSRSTMPWCSA